MTRRRWVLGLSALGAAFAAAQLRGRLRPAPEADGAPPAGGERDCGNFRVIYGSPELRARFRNFLDNVFHLYPTQELDELIAECVAADPRDPAVFRQLEARLAEVTPLLGSLRYALPALSKQKTVMAEQTLKLVGPQKSFRGYLEIGSHGRYLDALRSQLEISGPIFTTAPRLPGHGPEDIVDRGSVGLVGTPLPWADYAPFQGIQPGSLALITVYIGFHHAAQGARAPFLRSIREALAPDGLLIVRDHNVVTPELDHLVGLAHDVFNAGTRESFATNNDERRHFYSIAELIQMLSEAGLVAQKERLLQEGDPTQNTLLAFTKA